MKVQKKSPVRFLDKNRQGMPSDKGEYCRAP